MALNILDLVKQQITGDVVSKAASLLGESETGTKTALGAALPTVLGSLVSKGATTDGVTGIMNMLKDGNFDGSVFNNLSGLLSGGDASSSFLNSGGGLLKTLLGDKLGGVADMIGSIAGIKSGSSSSILSMAAPLIMGMLGKQVSGGGLGISGLANLLMGQSDFVKAALPSGLSNMMGFANLGDFKGDLNKVTTAATDAVKKVEDVRSTVTHTAQQVEEQATGGLGKILPWLLALAAAAGLFYWMRGCNAADTMADKAKDATTAVVDKAKDAAATTTTAVTDAAAKVAEAFKKTLPGGVELNAPKGSLEEQLVTFIEDPKAAIDKTKWFDFDRLLFDTGKATLQASSQEQLKNIAAIMKAFPAVEVKLGGYTDNVGNKASNLKLSDARAKTVMAELVKLGIDAKRMAAEGYGDANPVASNDTEEGRQKNRRISLSVRKK